MTMVVGQIHEMDAAARARYYTNILERVLATPGVAAAGLNDYIPLTNEDDYENFEIEGRPLAAQEQAHREEWRRVSASYFSSIAIPLFRGRDFTEHDDATAPSVTIVNQTMARKYWPNEDPVGRRIRIHGGAHGWSEIVGIVRDVREVGLDVAPKPMFFVPTTAPLDQCGPLRPHDGESGAPRRADPPADLGW